MHLVMSYFLNSGQAAVIVLGNALISKIYMTCAWRFKLAGTDKKGRIAIVESAEYKNCHAAQLNDAEYSPIFIGTLLFLANRGINAPIASTLAAVGSVSYLWCKMYLPFPWQAIGATMRYISMGLIALELYKIFFNSTSYPIPGA